MEDDRPDDRRFWVCADVEQWIKVNTTDPETLKDPGAAAVWWCCYRSTEVLVDDTIRHIAQALMSGVGPFEYFDVTNMVQDWMDDDGNVAVVGPYPSSGANDTQIDAAIEADLRRFFGLDKGASNG